MSTYYEPEDVKANGRKTNAFGGDHAMSKSMSRLQSGEVMVAVIDRYMFEQAVDVSDKAEFDEFYAVYAQGYAKNFVVYAYKVGE